MEILALINSASGTVQRVGLDHISSTITDIFRSDGHNLGITSGAVPDLLERLDAFIASDTASGFVVSVGGDGTIAAIASKLAGTGIPLLPAPAGTMNCLATDLGFEMDIATACRQALDGHVVDADIARINGQVFMNSVVFGTFAKIAEVRENGRDNQNAADVVSSVAEVLEVLQSSSDEKFYITIENETIEAKTNTLMVSNNLFKGASGLTPLRERIDQGVLGIYDFDSHTNSDFIGVLLHALRGDMSSIDSLSILPCQKCTIDLGQTATNYTVDGEPASSAGKLYFTIEPKAIKLMAPALL